MQRIRKYENYSLERLKKELLEPPQRKILMENEQLKLQVEHFTRMLQEVKTLNQNLHDELEDKTATYEILEDDMSDLNRLLSKRSQIKHSNVELESQVSILKERLEMAESLAEFNEAVATEARQIAEEGKSYAQVKEEEVSPLEKSVEELECKVNALQEQVKIVKEEAERQKLQRNEIEMGEDSVCDTANSERVVERQKLIWLPPHFVGKSSSTFY